MVAPGANARLQPKSAFSCFPPVHTIGPEGQLRVDLTRSPHCLALTAICAFRPYASSSCAAPQLRV